MESSFTSPVRFGDRNFHILLYADDMVLMASSAESLQQKIDVLKKYFKQNLLTLNTIKSNIVIFNSAKRLSLKTFQNLSGGCSHWKLSMNITTLEFCALEMEVIWKT